MRVILSRKGFDSSYGGYPSPILPDGTLLSLPIPSPGDGIRYSELQFNDEDTYYDLMKELGIKLKLNNKRYTLNKQTECHLDPDLVKPIIKREKDWKPLFGQINQSQTHLENQGVGNNDLFLFFGWFRQTQLKNGKLSYVKDSPDLHVIFGYLQVERVVKTHEEKVNSWMNYHPHIYNNSRVNKTSNAIYVGRDKLSWFNKSGADTLKLKDELVLTKNSRTRSIWNLPEFFRKLKITYHSNTSWKEDGSFHSAKKGQEFVIEENELIEHWAKSLIADK